MIAAMIKRFAVALMATILILSVRVIGSLKGEYFIITLVITTTQKNLKHLARGVLGLNNYFFD